MAKKKKQDQEENQEKKKDTRFKKGVSGNPAGRPKGSVGKQMSLEQIQSYLSEGSRFAMNTILEVMAGENTSESTRLRAALAWLDADIRVRKEILKKINDEQQFKSSEQIQAAKDMEKNTDKDEEEEEDDTPAVSLCADD